MKALRRCICIVSMAMSLCIWPVNGNAQNIFRSVKEKLGLSSEKPSKKSSEKKDDKKTKSDDKKVLSVRDLSLDENLLYPDVPVKQHEAVAEYMSALAKKLASRKLERIELMRDGEVVVATIGSDNLFAPNDTVLRSSAGEFLKAYADLLRQVGMYRMVVVSHTDDTGSESYTDHLSEARAAAVGEWLSKDQIEGVTPLPYALGATDPLVPNDSRDNRAKNRRIEIYIIPDRLIIEMAKSGMLKFKN